MSVLKSFFKDTFIYGLAIVLPRLINLVLIPLHTNALPNEGYSENTEFYIIIALFNVVLTYGMETAFFRFFSAFKEQQKVYTTALISIVCTTVLFIALAFFAKESISKTLHINPNFYTILLSITFFDTLVVIPFAYLRVTGQPIRFTSIKILNVLLIVLLNVFFLSEKFSIDALKNLFSVRQTVEYIFIANVIGSGIIFLIMLPYYFKNKWQFSFKIWKDLLRYSLPIMVAGLAFVINENFDKWLLPQVKGEYINGAYSACYKLAVFMTLFIQAFRMGAEPFFFNYAKQENAKQTYASILKYFIIFGAIGLLIITVYIDWLQPLLIKKESYVIALDIVPIVLLANLCLGIYHNLSVWYKLTDKTKYGMYFSSIGACITIAFNYFYLPKIGFMACAYATLCAYGVMMLLSYFFGQKQYPVPYPIKRISLYLFSSSFLAYCSYYVFNRNILIGTSFLVIFLILVYLLEKDEFQQILKKR